MGYLLTGKTVLLDFMDAHEVKKTHNINQAHKII